MTTLIAEISSTTSHQITNGSGLTNESLITINGITNTLAVFKQAGVVRDLPEGLFLAIENDPLTLSIGNITS
nr:hypothetical protein [uncultured Polynucleobacter sp.]